MLARRPSLPARCVTRAAQSPVRTVFAVSAESTGTTLPLVPDKNSRDNRNIGVPTTLTVVNAARQR